MAGNTRGKLKEHFKGIDSNFKWIINHINDILVLVEKSLQYTEDYVAAGDDKEKQQEVLLKNPVYSFALSLAEGVKTLHSITGDVYNNI